MSVDIRIPWHHSIQVLKTHDLGIVAVNKPPGLLSHPNDKNSIKNSVVRAEFDKQDECYQWSENKIYLCNRLDSPTSGILIFATNAKIKGYLDQLFKDNKVKKTYYALVKGSIRQKNDLWQDKLKTQKGKNLRTDKSNQGFESKTKVSVIKSTFKTPIPLSLLELQPLTGRTHQLRVQTSLRKVPIIGDKTYGDFKANRLLEKTLKLKRLCLHARETTIPLPNGDLFKIFSKCEFETVI